MPITVNENGILHELAEVYTNENGIVYELDTIHSNDNGVLHEIHSAFAAPDEIIWTLNNGASATFENGGLKVVVDGVGGGTTTTGSTTKGTISATVDVPANTRIVYKFTNSNGYIRKVDAAPTGINNAYVSIDGAYLPTIGSKVALNIDRTDYTTPIEITKNYSTAQSVNIKLSGYLHETIAVSSSSGVKYEDSYNPIGYICEISFSKI